MNNNTSLSLIPSESEFHQLQFICKKAVESGLYNGIGGEAKILMILLAAREMNLPLMQSLNGGIWNIQGRIEISARLMSAMIRARRHNMKVIQCDSTKCIIEGKRNDTGDTFTAQFTIQDAQKAGLVKNNRDGSPGTWMKYAEDMLYARAMSRLARRLFPDIIGTAYVEGEIRDAEFEVISSEIHNEPIEPDPEAMLGQFMQPYLKEDRPLIVLFFNRHAAHYNKSLLDSLTEYADQDKFIKDFSIFKKQEEKKRSNPVHIAPSESITISCEDTSLRPKTDEFTLTTEPK